LIAETLEALNIVVNLRKTRRLGDDFSSLFKEPPEFPFSFCLLGDLTSSRSKLSKEVFEKLVSSKLISLGNFLGDRLGLPSGELLFWLELKVLGWGLLAGLSPF